MSTIAIDKSWLVDKITISKVIGEDDWQKPEYGEPIEFENCRVDLTKQYTGTGNNREIVANATVFFYAQFTTNIFTFDDTWLKAKVTYDGHEYLVTDYANYHSVNSKDLYSVELKVI